MGAMSEPSGWTAPGASGGQPPAGQQPGAPGHHPPPTGGWGAPTGGAGSRAWAVRAPRPGIVPLRPLSLGELWDGAFQAVRSNPGPLLGSSAVVVVITTALTTVLQGLLTGDLLDSMASLSADPSASPDQVFSDLGASVPGYVAGLLVTVVLTLVATAALTGVVTVSVSTAVLGRRTAARDLWRRVRDRLGSLVAVALVAGLAPGLCALLLVTPGFALLLGGAASASDGALVSGVLVLLLGALLGAAAALFLSTRLFLAPAVLMLEGQPVGAALRRAWQLSRRGFWRLLGISLLTTVCISVATGVVTFPFQLLAQVIGAAVGPDSGLFLPVTLGVTAVGTALVSTVLYPLQSAVTALQYVDQRMRQEGLDVELTRAASQ